MLRALCEDSVQFRSMMAIVIGASTDQVLTVITYLDEVIPGNVLNPDNARKSWAVYMSCLELPQWMLQLEDCWLAVAVIRTRTANEIDGGLASSMRCLYEHFIRLFDDSFRPASFVRFFTTCYESRKRKIYSGSIASDYVA